MDYQQHTMPVTFLIFIQEVIWQDWSPDQKVQFVQTIKPFEKVTVGSLTLKSPKAIALSGMNADEHCRALKSKIYQMYQVCLVKVKNILNVNNPLVLLDCCLNLKPLLTILIWPLKGFKPHQRHIWQN